MVTGTEEKLPDISFDSPARSAVLESAETFEQIHAKLVEEVNHGANPCHCTSAAMAAAKALATSPLCADARFVQSVDTSALFD